MASRANDRVVAGLSEDQTSGLVHAERLVGATELRSVALAT
jgi:hypothetical protein